MNYFGSVPRITLAHFESNVETWFTFTSNLLKKIVGQFLFINFNQMENGMMIPLIFWGWQFNVIPLNRYFVASYSKNLRSWKNNILPWSLMMIHGWGGQVFSSFRNSECTFDLIKAMQRSKVIFRTIPKHQKVGRSIFFAFLIKT